MEPDTIVLASLRRLDEKADRLAGDMLEVTSRLGILAEQYASISRRLDRLDERADRIERRLERTPMA